MNNDTFEIELTAMAHGGSALGRHNGRTVFVPYTIPGERIEARTIEDRGRVAFAEGLRLMEASADRVFPECKHFGPGKCSRCQWQHIDYAAQFLLKQDVLADQLARIGGFDNADVRPVIPSEARWGYNHHMTFNVDNGAVGFPTTQGNTVILIDECHILHPDLLDLYTRLDFEDLSNVGRLKLQIGSDGTHMVIFYMDTEDAPDLETNLPTSLNMVLPDNTPVNLIGDSHLHYTVAEHNFRVTAGSFFRANISQLDNLKEAAITALDPQGDEAVLDLYAGVGFFSAFIAPRVSLVTMVDSYPPAVTDADENLAVFDNVDVLEGPVEMVLEAFEAEAYDAAVLDPPVEGLSVEVIDGLSDLNLPKLIYISSDPATLARDTRRLVKHGYHLVYVQPIDLSPQTYHIDCIAVLQR